MTDLRFRRSRYARFAPEELLDELQAEHDALSPEDQATRNAWVDSFSDDDLREELGDRLPADAGDDSEGDGEPANRPRRSRRSAAGSGDGEPGGGG